MGRLPPLKYPAELRIAEYPNTSLRNLVVPLLWVAERPPKASWDAAMRQVNWSLWMQYQAVTIRGHELTVEALGSRPRARFVPRIAWATLRVTGKMLGRARGLGRAVFVIRQPEDPAWLNPAHGDPEYMKLDAQERDAIDRVFRAAHFSTGAR